MVKRLLSIICSISFVALLGACSTSINENNSSESTTSAPIVSDTAIEETTSQETSGAQESEEITVTNTGTEVLVIIFSQTGHTMGIAEKIVAIEGADLYEIVPAVPYTEEDLDYNNSDSRATVEQNDPSVRPEIESDPIDLSKYSKIYIGYPIWWGQEPRIMDTFVESYDFGDATVIPFCTSGSSGIGQSGTNLATNAGSGNWLEGQRFASDASEDDVRSWIEEMNI